MTRAELKTWIKSMGHGTDTDTVQNDMLLRALQELEGRRDWGWLEDFLYSATNLSAGNHTVGMPTNIRKVLGVYLSHPTDTSQNFSPLTRISSDLFNQYDHLDRTTGVPRYFMTTQNSIFVYPRPDLAYIVNLHKISSTATTSFDADGESPPFDERFHIILGWRVLQWLAFRQRDWEQAGQAEGEYLKLLHEMEQKDTSARKTGHVQRSDFYELVR